MLSPSTNQVIVKTFKNRGAQKQQQQQQQQQPPPQQQPAAKPVRVKQEAAPEPKQQQQQQRVKQEPQAVQVKQEQQLDRRRSLGEEALASSCCRLCCHGSLWVSCTAKMPVSLCVGFQATLLYLLRPFLHIQCIWFIQYRLADH
jgi:hemolysin activation/secretion protein